MSVVTVEECEKNLNAMTKLVKSNSDLAIVQSFTNEWQVKAYDRLKKSQERQKIISVILKVATEINIVVGAIATLVQIFI